MCFRIGTTPARVKRLKTVYKILTVSQDELHSPYYGAKYKIGVTKYLPKHLKRFSDDDNHAHYGLYAFTTLQAAIRWRDMRASLCSYGIIVKCKVDPKDLLFVKEDGTEATYRALTPVERMKHV